VGEHVQASPRESVGPDLPLFHPKPTPETEEKSALSHRQMANADDMQRSAETPVSLTGDHLLSIALRSAAVTE
jgi:hypothetical protein